MASTAEKPFVIFVQLTCDEENEFNDLRERCGLSRSDMVKQLIRDAVHSFPNVVAAE